jgi:arylsulfatase A-like enzyme
MEVATMCRPVVFLLALAVAVLAVAPAPWQTMYDPQKLRILPGWTEITPGHDLQFNRGYFPNDKLTESSLRRAMAYYYATISQIDHHVGRLTASLKERGLYDGTLIVFTADHGEYLGCHHMLLKGNHIYDPLVKVPLVIKWPAQRHAGQISERLVSNIDLAPTLCRAAGLTPPAEMPGEDLGAELPGREIVFCESGGNQTMARTQSHKLILDGKRPGQSLFFDLRVDPLELRNLLGSPEAQDEIQRLSAAIAAWRPHAMPNRYVDPQAPQIQGPNVPPPGLEHRQPIMDYYRAKMHELQECPDVLTGGVARETRPGQALHGR